MGFKLESLHLYRKVPRDLTDATSVGGAISVVCAMVMAYLFVSNISDYLKMQTTTDVALDDTGEVSMRIFFNITMERLPCQFAVVDVEDIMGTSVTNVSKEILKFKIAPDSGHRQEFYIDEQPSIVHEELDAEEAEMHMAMPTELPRLKDDDFERVVKQGDVSLIAFGAPWCPWSQRLEPIWRKTYAELQDKPYATHVRMGKVDCTSADSQALCQKHHIHAFPTIRIYRHRQLHSHENYLGDRDSAAFVSFIEEALPKGVVAGGDTGGGRREALPGISSKTEGHDMQGEGCQLTGSLQISRVPGNFRISAKSDSHSFNTRVMNVSHHVDKLVFGAINEAGRLKHVMPIEERSSLFSTSFMMHQARGRMRTPNCHSPPAATHRRDSMRRSWQRSSTTSRWCRTSTTFSTASATTPTFTRQTTTSTARASSSGSKAKRTHTSTPRSSPTPSSTTTSRR